MKTIYFDCSMGAAGDMLSAALIDALDEPEEFVAEFNALGISSVKMLLEDSEKRGVSGKHVRMLINGAEEGEHHHADEHHHRGLAEITQIIQDLPLAPQVKCNAVMVYKSIAHAEALVHGESVGEVHFHEVGALDAIADVVAFSMLLDRIAPIKVFASPINVGSGTVKCAHGVLPVPAPATEILLHCIPVYSDEIVGELCTPTGAALLKHFVDFFGDMPKMTVQKVGVGMGTKDFAKPNCVRATVGVLEN